MCVWTCVRWVTVAWVVGLMPSGTLAGQSGGSAMLVTTTRNASFALTSAANGVSFDINGDGTPERVAWTPPDSDIAFLAVDRNGDGRINNGTELIGNHTYPGVNNGISALERMNRESNGDTVQGAVDGEDPLFSKLLLWYDRNHNGISDPGELMPVHAVISAVGLGAEIIRRTDPHGNRYRFRGWTHIRTEPGLNRSTSPRDNDERIRHMWEVVLVSEPERGEDGGR